jgi:hypothetical protein
MDSLMALFRQLFGTKCLAGLALGTAVLVLSACGSGAYVDSRREAGKTVPVGPSTPDRVAICYSNAAGTGEQVLKMAESECAKTGRVPVRDHEDRWSCTMLTPRRIFFRCVPKP